MAQHQYAVLGVGRLGASIARSLAAMGHSVLGLEADADRVERLSDQMPDEVDLLVADATENNFLRDLGLEDFDGAAVTLGEHTEDNILVTLMLKELGVPLVLSRARDALDARILEKVGADYVVQPEREVGELLARRMAAPETLDYLELGEDEALVEMEVPKKWIGKAVADLGLYRKSGLTILAHKSKGQRGTIPRGDKVFHEGDVLIIGGSKKALNKFELFQRDRA
jgi:trk system potassium uptake protein TrkA